MLFGTVRCVTVLDVEGWGAGDAMLLSKTPNTTPQPLEGCSSQLLLASDAASCEEYRLNQPLLWGSC